MTNTTKQLSVAALCAVLLGACAQTPPQGNEPVAAKPQPSLDIAINDPWTVSANLTADGKVLIATTSHRDNYLEIWELTRERQLRAVGKDTAIGFHPDGVRWHGQSGDLYASAEGSRELQHWQVIDGKLSLRQKIPVEYAPINVVPVDLDQDGQLDLVSSPYAGEKLTLLWGKGQGEFTRQNLDAARTPHHARVADWDLDGKPDIIWSDYYAGSVRLARNLGQRKFAVTLLQDKGPGTPRQLEVGDIDGDGYPDLVMALETGKAARILFNDRKGGVLPEKIEIPAPSYGYSAVTFTRLNGIPLLAMSENRRIVLARPKNGANPRGEWERRGLPAGDLPQDLQFFDLDQDGEMDLYFANSGYKDVQIYFGPLWDKATPLP